MNCAFIGKKSTMLARKVPDVPDRVKAVLPKSSFHCFLDITSAKGKHGSVKYAKICSKHFKSDDFVFADLHMEGGKPRLKHDAVP